MTDQLQLNYPFLPPNQACFRYTGRLNLHRLLSGRSDVRIVSGAPFF